MRVAITHTRYTAKGGVERYIYDLVKRLLDVGHEVHFFCHFHDEHVDPRVVIHTIPNTFKQIRFMKVWHFDRWLRRNVRREDWDIVHGFSKSSEQDIYTDGSGCLLDYQAYSIDEAVKSPLGRWLRRSGPHQRQVLAIEARRFSRGNFHKVVTMADLVAEQIKRRYGLNDDEVVTIYNGIDAERFRPELRAEHRAPLLTELGLPADAFVVLCVANDYRRKGVATLIEAARLLRERGGLPEGRPLRFLVVGKERPARVQEFEQLAQEAGTEGDLVLLGSQDKIERFHAAADLFALPTRFDAFGNVVLEALACGVPALVSVKAGAAEVVDHEQTGWVQQDPADAALLADTVLELAGDEAHRQAMGKAARAAAESYSWDRHFEHMLALYDEVHQLKTATPAGKSGTPSL